MEAKEIALRSIEQNEKVNRAKAEKTLRKREKSVRNIIALWGYVNWARQNNLLLGGPSVESHIKDILADKPYSKGCVHLSLDLWDIVDLTNERTFRRYAKESLVLDTSIRELLFLTQKELLQIKATRPKLLKWRKKCD